MTTRKVLRAGGIQGDQFSVAAYYTGVETPKGFTPVVVLAKDQPVLRNINLNWPRPLGLREVMAKSGGPILVKAPDDYDPLPPLAIGRSAKAAHWPKMQISAGSERYVGFCIGQTISSFGRELYSG